MFDPESRKHNKTWKCYNIDLTKNVVFSKVDIPLHSVTLKFRQWNLIIWMTSKYPFHVVRNVLLHDLTFVWTCNRCVQDAPQCRLYMDFSWIQKRFEIMFHTMHTPAKLVTITKRRFCINYLQQHGCLWTTILLFTVHDSSNKVMTKIVEWTDFVQEKTTFLYPCLLCNICHCLTEI